LPDAGEELFDLVEDSVLIADPRQMVDPAQLDKPGSGNPGRQVAALFDRRIPVARAMEDERRHPNGRQHWSEVDLAVHPAERHRCSRTGSQALQASPPVPEPSVCAETWR
jgi:hypothetical protein